MITGWNFSVAPHMGAWIEIICGSNNVYWSDVAPHMGAWIEINISYS